MNCTRCGVRLTKQNRYHAGRFKWTRRCKTCGIVYAGFGNRNVMARPLGNGLWELYENGVKL